MFLKKVIKNNKGIDVTLIGTAWVFILIVSICAILDMFIITYSKESVINITKSIERYSLASNFDSETMYVGQTISVDNSAKQAIINTFKSQWNTRFYKLTTSSFITNLSYHSDIDVSVSNSNSTITLTVPNITFTPRKIIKTTTKIPFFGGTMKNYSNEIIKSGVATKLYFIK